MGLYNNTSRMTYVNVKKGKFYTKEKGGQPVFFTNLGGYITSVAFKVETLDGKTFEIAQFMIEDAGERNLLQLRTDSGYFRGFCNSLKSGQPTEYIDINPNYSETDGKSKTTVFVVQNGKTLKHAHTLNNMGDMPELELSSVDGKQVWDSSKQVAYWKKWLASQNWKKSEASEEESPKNTNYSSDIVEDDLPF